METQPTLYWTAASPLIPQCCTPGFAWSLISPPVAVLDTSHGPVQCLTHTVLLVDSGKIFYLKDKIAIFENMTSKINLLQHTVYLFNFNSS